MIDVVKVGDDWWLYNDHDGAAALAARVDLDWLHGQVESAGYTPPLVPEGDGIFRTRLPASVVPQLLDVLAESVPDGRRIAERRRAEL